MIEPNVSPELDVSSGLAYDTREVPHENIFLYISEDRTYATAPGFHSLAVTALLIADDDQLFSPWGCHKVHAASLSYTLGKTVPSDFNVRQYLEEQLKFPCLGKAEAQKKMNEATAARAKRIAAQLRTQYAEQYAGIEGVELPTNLTDEEKRKFLHAFSLVRGPRQTLADLIAAGSVYCSGVSSNRTVHFEEKESELYCSILGCAVLGITAGRVPETCDPEVLFWTVHAAARLITGSPSLAPIKLERREESVEINRASGVGTKNQYHYSGWWGPGKNELFELFLGRASFAEVASILMRSRYKELEPIVWRPTEKQEQVCASRATYASAYLQSNTSFGKY